MQLTDEALCSLTCLCYCFVYNGYFLIVNLSLHYSIYIHLLESKLYHLFKNNMQMNIHISEYHKHFSQYHSLFQVMFSTSEAQEIPALKFRWQPVGLRGLSEFWSRSEVSEYFTFQLFLREKFFNDRFYRAVRKGYLMSLNWNGL